MEFKNISKYINVKNGNIVLSFDDLRRMKPILVTQNLDIVNTMENMVYVQSLAEAGIIVAPIRRINSEVENSKSGEFPNRIMFEMTSRCNFLCKMCPQQDLHRLKMDMPGDQYRKVIDEIDRHGTNVFWPYHFGEATLHPEFVKNIEYISKKKNLGKIWLSTNCSKFNEEFQDCVINSNIDYMNFSIQACTEETYKKITINGNFRRSLKNLNDFLRKKPVGNKPFSRVAIIEQPETLSELDSFIRIYHNRADVISINLLEHISVPGNIKNLALYKKRERKPLTSCARISRGDCFVDADGDVTICDEAYNKEMVIGNTNDNTLHEIWNGDIRKKYLDYNNQGRMAELDFCKHCVDYDL